MKNGGIEWEKSDASQWCASLEPKPVEPPKEEQPDPAYDLIREIFKENEAAPAPKPPKEEQPDPATAPKPPKEIPDDLTPIQPYVLTSENCSYFTDPTGEMEEAEYLWDGKKPEHDQDFHDYHIKQKGKNT
tara:strand:+ start:76 stop:468 length:393 start_codon:yes stop_codon:yes gene_type:complete